MNRIKSLVAAAAIVALLPVLAVAQKTSFDFDKSADFTKLKTFAFKDGTKIGDPLVDNRIIAAIEAALVKKGLTKNDATPDAVVVYHIAFDKKQDITTYSSGSPEATAPTAMAGAAALAPLTCASTRSPWARWSSMWPTRPRSRWCGEAWASRRSMSRQRRTSGTRTSRPPSKRSSRTSRHP